MTPCLSALLGGQLLAGHDQPERPLDTNQARQTLRAAGTRHEAHTRLGEADLRVRRVHRDAAMTGQRHLEPAAQADAVDGGHHGLAARLHAAQLVQHQAGLGQEIRGVDGPAAQRFNLLEVAARHEDAGLAAGQDDALHGVVGQRALHAGVQLRERLPVEHVHGLALLVPTSGSRSRLLLCSR
jgi:hypothetical protein